MNYNTKVKLIILTIVGGILLICVVVCVGKAAVDSGGKTPKPSAPEIADDSAGERNAIMKVQNYRLPDGETILENLTAEVATYRFLGSTVRPQGWYAGKWGEKYNVGFEAKVDSDNMKWRFFYYPDTGKVEPANNEAKKLW